LTAVPDGLDATVASSNDDEIPDSVAVSFCTLR
jgi:hypothetical protein